MARIHIDPEDELPELGELLRPKHSRSKNTASPREDQPPKEKSECASAKEESSVQKSKQRSFKKLNGNSSLFGPFDASTRADTSSLTRAKDIRKSPRKAQRTQPIEVFQDEVKDEFDDKREQTEDASFHFSDGGSDEDGSDGDGSDGDSWLAPLPDRESPFKRLLKSRPKSPLKLDDTLTLAPSSGVNELSNPFLGPRMAPPTCSAAPNINSSRPTSSSSALDNAAILHYTPPKRLSPSKISTAPQSITPPREQPPSPSKKLSSPSKARFTSIPRAPIRESLDAFWSQDTVNDWNEQYSPRKMLESPRKQRFITPTSEEENDPPSPSTSPRRRSPQKIASPVKSKEAKQMKKAWDVRKKELAIDFLKELDDTISQGKLSEMTANTGGVELIWSKKLNTTAGRANWRREKIRDPASDGSVVVSYKHTANIELAEKVIDDEVKLINVLAHEFCHLCNFMISGIRDAPHGKEFKEWAKKCSRAFGSRGIEVTTKHSYDIDYKYVWECVECSLEFKRHSKSIDPLKQACGKCKGKLVQTKPIPREGKASEYQLFVKEHCQRVKRENPGLSHKAAMEMLAGMWKEKKAGASIAGETDKLKMDVEEVVRELEIITLED